TENVARMSLNVGFLPNDKPVLLQIDGNRTLTVASRADTGWVQIEKSRRGRWRLGAAGALEKTPQRGGRFKSVFDNNAILVYSTGGATEENAWSLAKARYDAQTFWYRGNGSLEVIADKDFDPDSQRNRNVVLYGNTDTNLALPALLSTCPVRVRGGKVLVRSEGIERAEEGENLAALFVRPRFGSRTASVGLVGGAGLPGMRLTNRIRYFLAGVNLPDLTIIGADAPTVGDEEVRAAGYFGADWRIETGDIEWRDLAL
ncbi:MAG: hypothetical protein KDA37_13240, partial [Planctomycetales bacterium]|nr:hypothetical protein [Planctomycetales bacterium]